MYHGELYTKIIHVVLDLKGMELLGFIRSFLAPEKPILPY